MKKEVIGNAELYLGDCLDVLPLLDNVDAVVTDPPWKASSGTRVNRRPGDGMGVAPSRLSTSLAYGDIGLFDKGIIASFLDVSDADVIVLCGYMELGEVIDALSPVRGVLIWHNSRPTPIPGVLSKRDVAFLVWAGRKTKAGKNGEKWKSCLFTHNSPQAGCFATERILNRDGSTLHPAQEPLHLFEELLLPISGTILDPYMGSGTTGVACMNLGRKFIGIEIEPKYFDIACERIDMAQRQGSLF